MTTKRFFSPDQLSAIRAQCDWRRLLDGLGVRAEVRRCTETEFWGFSPFNPDEKTASFHMKAPGIWYDWSSKATAPGRSKPGGGVIELVQAIQAARGHVMKLNEAAGWLVDHGYAGLSPTAAAAAATSSPPTESNASPKTNAPITIDLVPQLSEQGVHPIFRERGISEQTCRYLRCGRLKTQRGVLAGHVVFQVGGVTADRQSRVILSHVGRATTPKQAANGKWRFYRGFNPSLELYNQDNLLLDPVVATQAATTGRILLVEGTFDVAKCIEAGLRNVVASFGTRLSEAQASRLGDFLTHLAADSVCVFFDRDATGRKGASAALDQLQARGISATAFDWDQEFGPSGGVGKPIPESILDPCDFSVRQLRWLHERGLL